MTFLAGLRNVNSLLGKYAMADILNIFDAKSKAKAKDPPENPAPVVDIATNPKYHEQRLSHRKIDTPITSSRYDDGIDRPFTLIFSETSETPRSGNVADPPRPELDPNFAELMGAGMVQPLPTPQSTAADLFRCAVRSTWLALAGFWRALWGLK